MIWIRVWFLLNHSDFEIDVTTVFFVFWSFSLFFGRFCSWKLPTFLLDSTSIFSVFFRYKFDDK